MNPKTQDRLRDAAIDALRQKEDESALELLVLFLPISHQPPLINSSQHSGDSRFPALPLTSDGRNYHFWVAAITDHYLPYILNENIAQFSSRELYSWVKSSGFPLTSGDLNLDGDGREYWKSRVSKALSALCQKQIIWRHGMGSPNYTTVKPNRVLSPS